MDELRKSLIKDTGWTLNQVDESDYWELLELFSEKKKMVPLADFLRRGRKTKG